LFVPRRKKATRSPAPTLRWLDTPAKVHLLEVIVEGRLKLFSQASKAVFGQLWQRLR
jgi:hypothetical protein